METVADFQNAVQRDLAWRKLEISALRTLVNQSDEDAHYVFRATQVLLCAHWEGFLKKAARLYLEHVFAQNILLKDMVPCMVAVAYFDDVLAAASAKFPGSELNHLKLAEKIVRTINGRVERPSWNVDTEGNPGTDTLERVLRSIGVDPQLEMELAAWTTTRVFINEQIVRDRHYVAHGDGFRIDRASLLARVQRLLDLLDTLSDRLQDAAVSKRYMRP